MTDVTTAPDTAAEAVDGWLSDFNAALAAGDASAAADLFATTSFWRSNRPRGTGIARRYRNDDQLASLATVSPQNNATITTSRKPTDANSAKSAKTILTRYRRPSSKAVILPLIPLPILGRL